MPGRPGEQSHIKTIVAAVSKRFSEVDTLKPDGSNLRQWERLLCHHALEYFGNPDFFAPNENQLVDPSDEKVGRRIINASVHTDLTYNVLNLPTTADVFSHLMMNFCVVNRAAQLQGWLKFIHTNSAAHDTTASLHEAFRNSAKTSCKQGMTLGWDEWLDHSSKLT